MNVDLPDDLAEQIAQLGDPLGQFAVGRRTLWLLLIGGPCLIVAGVGIFALIIERVVWHPKVLIFALVLIVAGVVLLVRAAKIRGVQVLVFPEGLLRCKGDRTQYLFWDEIDQVFWKKPSGIWVQMASGSRAVVLKAAPGKEIQFDDSLQNFEDLSETIRRQTYQPLLTRALNSLELGQVVDFGALQASRTGLRKQGERLHWREIGEVRQEKEDWRIYRKGQKKPWYTGPASEIGNVHILTALVNSQAVNRN